MSIVNTSDLNPDTLKTAFNKINEAFTEVESTKASKSVMDTALDNKVDKIPGKGLSANDYTNEEKQKLSEVNNKVDKIPGKGLSTNDYTNDEKAALAAVVFPHFLFLRGSSMPTSPAILTAAGQPFPIPEGEHMVRISIFGKRRDRYESYAKWEKSTILVNIPTRVALMTGVAAYPSEQRTSDLATWFAGQPVTLTVNATTKALDITITNNVKDPSGNPYQLPYTMDYVAKIELLTM